MVVTGLLTGHNSLRRHFFIIGLIDSPLCRRCGAKEVTSAHVLCECEAVKTDVLTWVAFAWNFITDRGLP
jgi:hypothetical protein